MEITDWSEKIIIGCLFGNGYILDGKRPYLGISETRDHDWLHYKAILLKDLGAKTPLAQCGKALKWRSESGEIWNCFRKKFYKNNMKNADIEVLNSLKARSLAIWYGDKGFWYSNKKIGLRTTAFGESNRTIAAYFNEVGIPCIAKKDTHGAYRIVFDREGTICFLKMIARWLPEIMYHRLEF